VSSYSGCEELVTSTYEKFGKLDILCLIAGTIIKNPIDEMTEAQFDKVVAVNLKQCYNMCHFAAKYMKQQKHGRIVCYASRGAFGNFHAPTQSCCYAASKAGVIGFCSELAIELIPFGDIKVNCVLPGAQTKLFPNERKQSYGGVPGAWPSRPEMAAPMTTYLCTDECDCTGELFYIGGTDVGIYPRDRKVIGFMHKSDEQKWDLDELIKMVPEVFGWYFATRPAVSSYRL
jgi:3-oxoacyl-[acyl-carrier protein] reductase